MKKVRYAIGAAGIAPALGLMAPAAALATHTPNGPKDAKTVSLAPVRTAVHTRACLASGVQHTSEKNNFQGGAFYNTVSSPSVCSVSGFLFNKHQGGLEMRIRLYHEPSSVSGPFRTTYVHGYFSNPHNNTVFSSKNVAKKPVRQMWLALVSSKHHSKVLYGPVKANIP